MLTYPYSYSLDGHTFKKIPLEVCICLGKQKIRHNLASSSMTQISRELFTIKKKKKVSRELDRLTIEELLIKVEGYQFTSNS